MNPQCSSDSKYFPARFGRAVSALLAAAALGWATGVSAQVTLTTSDSIGTSSFAPGYGATNWSDGLAPHLSATYNANGNTLRTPSDTPAFIFQGASLTLPTGSGLTYKGTASAAITITNLILNGGSIGNGVGGTYSLYGGITLSNNSTFNPTSGRGVNVYAPISGGYAITNAGGTVILSGPNTFTGGIQVLSGATLQVGRTNALPQPAGGTPVVNVLSGGALDLGGVGNSGSPGIVSTGLVQVAGIGNGGTGGALSTASGGYMNTGYNYIYINNVSLTGNTTVGNNGGSGPTLGGGSDFMIGYTGLGLSGNGYSLTKIGANALYMCATALSAPSAVNVKGGGIVLWGSAGANAFSNAPITLYSNAWVEPYGGNTTFNLTNNFTVDTSGGQILNDFTVYGSQSYLNINGSVALNGPLVAQDYLPNPTYYSQGTLVFNGVISGSGALLLNQGATNLNNLITLNTNNSFSGGLLVGGGKLRIQHSGAWGSSAQTITLTNGTIVDTYDPVNWSGYTIPNNIVIGSTNGTGGASIYDDTGSYYHAVDQDIYSGSFTLNAPLGIVVNNSLTGVGGMSSPTNYGSVTISGIISGTNGISIVGGLGVGGVGIVSNTVVLSGQNTFSGPVTVSNAVLKVTTGSQGGGSYTILDNSILDAAVATSANTLPTAALTLGVSTGAQLSFGRLVALPSTPVIYATNLTINGTVKVTGPGSGYSATGEYPLVKYGSISGFSGLTLATLPSGATGYLTNNTANSSVDLVVTYVQPDVWVGNVSSTWDVNTTTNWSINGIGSTFNQADAVVFNDSASAFTVSFATNVSPSSVTVSNTANVYTFAQGSGNLTGTMSLVKNGTNTLIVQNATNNFTGGTYINNGILQLGDRNYAYTVPGMYGALNDALGNVYVNGGTLDINGICAPNYASYGPEGYNVYLIGSGYNGQGALINSLPGNNGYAPDAGYITLAGNATIGGPGEINMWGGVSPLLSTANNAYTLTKTGTGAFRIRRGSVSSNFGNIQILQGSVTYEGAVPGIGSPTNSIIIGTNATFSVNASSVPLNKLFVCSNGAAISSLGGSGPGTNVIAGTVSVVPGASVTFTASSADNLVFSNPIVIPYGTINGNNNPLLAGGITNISGTVTLTGNTTIGGPVNIPSGSTLQYNGNYYNTLTISNVLSGSGNFGIQYQSVVELAASNTFTGNITVPNCNSGSGGHLDLIGNGSISQVPSIRLQGIAAGQAHAAYMTVTGRTDGTFTLATNQTFQADNGSQVIGNLTVSGGATFKMNGFQYTTVTGNLTFLTASTNNIEIDRDTATNDQIYVDGAVTFAGTLNVSVSGSALQAGDSFQVFPNSGSTTYSGSFDNIVPATPGTGLAWDTNALATTGYLNVISAGPTPFTVDPGVTGITLSGADVNINVSSAQSGDAYYVLTSTNLTLPVSQWTVVSTNVPTSSGAATFTASGAVISGATQQFFILSNTNFY